MSERCQKDISLTVRDRYFSAIKEGKKSVEIRLRKPKFMEIEPDDMLILKNGERALSLPVKVTYVNHYATFKEALRAEGLENCLPGIKTVEEGETIYWSFPGYREDEEKLGVMAIGVKVQK